MPCSWFVMHTYIFLHSFESVSHGTFSPATCIATSQGQVLVSLRAEDVVANTYSPSWCQAPGRGISQYGRCLLVAQRSSGLTSHSAGPGALAWLVVWPWEHLAGGKALACAPCTNPLFIPNGLRRGRKNGLQAGRP
jgi:hypothetical protein